ncbi:MAG TPA: hypothetical protein VGJ14_05850 [Sporichthyaceae bacterium]
MRRDDARSWFVTYLMRKVRTDTYPSTTDLDLIEAVIPHHMLDEYVEILIEKVESARFPSIGCCAGSTALSSAYRSTIHEADEEPEADAVKA